MAKLCIVVSYCAHLPCSCEHMASQHCNLMRIGGSIKHSIPSLTGLHTGQCTHLHATWCTRPTGQFRAITFQLGKQREEGQEAGADASGPIHSRCGPCRQPGGWVWARKGVQLPLFRLSGVCASPLELVLPRQAKKIGNIHVAKHCHG
ncbi:hypothetical protein ABPG77_000728 [Micractinium sp. CCAP 211/92]